MAGRSCSINYMMLSRSILLMSDLQSIPIQSIIRKITRQLNSTQISHCWRGCLPMLRRRLILRKHLTTCSVRQNISKSQMLFSTSLWCTVYLAMIHSLLTKIHSRKMKNSLFNSRTRSRISD